MWCYLGRGSKRWAIINIPPFLKEQVFCTKRWPKGSCQKKTFFWDIFPKSVYPPTHPRVFVRFGNTKGEFSFVQKLWFSFGKLCPHPPMFGRNFPKKRCFFIGNFFFVPSLRFKWGRLFHPFTYNISTQPQNFQQKPCEIIFWHFGR